MWKHSDTDENLFHARRMKQRWPTTTVFDHRNVFCGNIRSPDGLTPMCRARSINAFNLHWSTLILSGNQAHASSIIKLSHRSRHIPHSLLTLTMRYLILLSFVSVIYSQNWPELPQRSYDYADKLIRTRLGEFYQWRSTSQSSSLQLESDCFRNADDSNLTPLLLGIKFVFDHPSRETRALRRPYAA